jgi:hypothetical protein
MQVDFWGRVPHGFSSRHRRTKARKLGVFAPPRQAVHTERVHWMRLTVDVSLGAGVGLTGALELPARRRAKAFSIAVAPFRSNAGWTRAGADPKQER